jgi:hypothetical protein
MHDATGRSQFFNANSFVIMDARAPMMHDITDKIYLALSQTRHRGVKFQDLEYQEDSGPSPQSQRRVRFPEVEWQEISVPETLYDEEPDKKVLWYQKTELRCFKKSNQKLIRDYHVMMKHIHQSSLVPPSRNHYSKMKRLLEENMRGLEDYKSKNALVSAKKRRMASKQVVLLEQRYQKQNKITDPVRIRHVSLACTSLNKLIALSKGKMDQLNVLEAYKPKRICPVPK